jgi:trans-2,3-dihydro-3-hydroxyanthranilate isomerase
VRFHDYVVLDVFTDTPLAGNQLAVFTEPDAIPAELMQKIAREMNLSETVFLLTPETDHDARLRIFTPAAELPFAGHPTLGTAFVVGERPGVSEVRLQTGAGTVRVTLERDGDTVVYGEMEQPLPTREPFDQVDALLAALGVERAELPIEGYRNGPLHVYVALGSEDQVARLKPDLGAIAELGVVGVNCFAGGAGRFKSRMFGPALGVAEDPATGSAAGPLAVHLARHGWCDYGEQIEITQGVEIGRPSLLRAQALGSDETLEQVLVGGSAVLVARGQYRID